MTIDVSEKFSNQLISAGLERIIIHESIHDEFLKRIKPMVQQLRQGPPLGCGIKDAGATVMSTQVCFAKYSYMPSDTRVCIAPENPASD